LSLTPYKDEDNLVKTLKIVCTANRERENLDLELNVNGTQIG